MNRGRKAGSSSVDHLETIARTWGTTPPVWVTRLAEVCNQSSQSEVAKKLPYTSSVISTVLHNSYKGDLSAVEAAVKGLLMAETVGCPVLGEIASHDCLAHQRKARHFVASSSIRVQLHRACRTCIHSRLGGKA